MNEIDTVYFYGMMVGGYEDAIIEVQYYDPNTDSSAWAAVNVSQLK